MVTFVGESVVSLGKLLRRTAQFRWSDTLLVMQECGPKALGIVALINFLIGLILAYVAVRAFLAFGPGEMPRLDEVGINPGAEQNAGIGAGVKATYPDAVL